MPGFKSGTPQTCSLLEFGECITVPSFLPTNGHKLGKVIFHFSKVHSAFIFSIFNPQKMSK
jgi:hypothetical protein